MTNSPSGHLNWPSVNRRLWLLTLTLETWPALFFWSQVWILLVSPLILCWLRHCCIVIAICARHVWDVWTRSFTCLSLRSVDHCCACVSEVRADVGSLPGWLFFFFWSPHPFCLHICTDKATCLMLLFASECVKKKGELVTRIFFQVPSHVVHVLCCIFSDVSRAGRLVGIVAPN